MMAKNIIQKKQRIAHNKTSFNNEDHEMFSENCGDFLSSIMEGMKNTNYLSVHSNNKFETHFPELSNIPSQKTQASKTLIPIPNHPIPKSKKFGVLRDCPLMKKCQKDLKLLKHNRQMPKPRAHLAGFSKSPVRKAQSLDSRSVSNAKLKKPKAAVNNVKNTASFKKNPEKPKTDIPAKQPKPSVPKRNLEQSSQKQETFSNKNNSEKCEVKITKTDTSDTDSDYEKFLKRQKKGLPKKPKKQNTRKLPNVATKRIKIFPKPLSSESESEESDEEFTVSKSQKKSKRRRKRDSSEESDDETFTESRSHHKKSKRRRRQRDSSEESDEFIVSKSHQKKNKKKRKNVVVENRLPASNKDSESEMDMNNDVPCHDSSSESDDLIPLSELQKDSESSSNPHSDNSRQYGLFSYVNMSTPLTMEHGQPNITQNNLNPASSFINQPSPSVFPSSASLKDNRQSSIHKINSVQSPSTALNNVQPTISHNSSIDSKLNSVPISSNTYSASSTKVVGKGACSTKNDLSNVRVKQENSNISVVVDLTESDNECDGSFTLMPKIVTICSQSVHNPSTSCDDNKDEDSEIELVDAILYEEKLPRKHKNTPQNPSNITNQLPIKTEINLNPTLNNANTQKQTDKLQTSSPSVKSEPVFSTGICKESDKIQWKTLNQSNVNNDKPPVNKSTAIKNSPVLAKVKTEPGDDIEIIEIVPSSKPRQNLNSAQARSNKTIKIEKELKVVEQTTVVNPLKPKEKEPLKVEDVGSPVHSTCKESPTFDYAYVNSLLDKLNTEFHTYQDIVNAEKSVEDTFKMLEMRQAEKCEFLKEQIDKILLNLPSIEDDQRDAIRAMLMNSSQLKSRKTPLSTDANIPSPDISIKDLKTFASMNIVPLSSISEMDIKPDVSKLQSSIKKEPGTAAETNNESFGEKCVVCTKDAKAACQQCAKVFFCSHECGKKYWNEGHKDACAK